jgi:outer membrane protein assembly factor BamB
MNTTLRLALLAGMVAAVLVWAGSALGAPAVTVTPAIVSPTQTITVGGSGFAAYAAVDVYLDSTDIALALADGSGNFSGITVPVPAAAVPGNHWLSIVDRHNGVGAQKLITVHTGWVEQGWNAPLRSLNPFENVLNPSNISGLEADWSATAGGSQIQYGSAAVAAGSRQVIFADIGGVVRAVSQLSGATLWTRSLSGAQFYSSPAIDSGRVYLHGINGAMYALNATTGATVWQTTIGGGGGDSSSPTVAANVVYVGSGDGNVYALNGSTGAVIWKGGPTGGPIDGAPAVSGGRVFVGSLDNSVYAFAVGCASGGASCNKLWSTATGNQVIAAPAVSNGVVYAASDDSKLYALNAGTGTINWTGQLPSYANQNSPAVANGVVYVGSRLPAVLSAFPTACGSNGASCSPLWQSPSYFFMDTTPAIANGVVYITANDTTNNGLVMGFPASCSNPCQPRWTASQPNSDVTRPVVSDGMVITGDNDGNLTAWDLPAVAHAPQPARPNPGTLKPDLTLKPTH